MKTASDLEIQQAAQVLLEGGLVAFPTETVYGLGADAESRAAVERIYQAKGRPSNHPVIVHVTPEADLSYWAASVPDEALALIDAFWPGPLTLILKRASHISDVVSGGQDSVGLRCPSHPIAQKLIRTFAAGKPSGQGGIAGPSANKFGQVSPTQSSHVRDEFPELVAAGMSILEGGSSEVGIESTIIDLSRLSQGVGPVLLRPGYITDQEISQVLDKPVHQPDAQAPRVSGALKSHYAPSTPIKLVKASKLFEEIKLQTLRSMQRLVCVTHSIDQVKLPQHDLIDWVTMPVQPAAYSYALYATLRALDQGNYACMLWEEVPDSLEWLGIQDRLGRAAAAF
ncbi:MAG: L-threonylcarbamoyladenylate synthase [Burkholderiaceae bacterium]|nr:L-threonylcarbamoyladenylate synthase [Burkholderiaceae bacterium]MDP4968477.1 L-threonylcarbamoyladenylate synthase [Burkholderiaceae bacterium]MDP5110829.1 L-threonylcarbamoyladenylate synthase [Burkholderiaceae bacterium]